MEQIITAKKSNLSAALQQIESRKYFGKKKFLARFKFMTKLTGAAISLMHVALVWIIYQLFTAKEVPEGSRLPDPNIMAAAMIVFTILIAILSALMLKSRLEQEAKLQADLDEEED